MPRDRLPTALWVSATVRRLSAEGAFAAVMARGEAESGILIVRVNTLDGYSRIETEGRDLDGRLVWITPLGEEAVSDGDADAYIERARGRDPDLWVVEVEDRAGNNPFSFDGGGAG